MLNPKIMARLAQKYFADNSMCPKCGGSLKCCHDDKEKE